MALFSAIKKELDKKSVWDKAKIANHILCTIGGGMIAGSYLNNYYEHDVDFGMFEKVTVFTTVYGLSIAGSQLASQKIDELIDACHELRDGLKVEMAEETEKPEKAEDEL